MVASLIFLMAALACSCVATRLWPLQAWHGLAPHTIQGPPAPVIMQRSLLHTPATLRTDALVRAPRIHMSIDSDIPDAETQAKAKLKVAALACATLYWTSLTAETMTKTMTRSKLLNLLYLRLFKVESLDNTAMVDGVPYYLRLFRHNLDKKHTSVWEAQNWVWRDEQEVRFAVLANQLDLRGKTVLDVGCGQGDFAKYLESTGNVPARLRGIDGIPEFVQSAQQTAPPWAEYAVGDFVADPSVLGSEWDVIILSGSLTTLEPAEQLRVLANCWRVSRRGMAFSFPPITGETESFANDNPIVWKMDWPGGRNPLVRAYAGNPGDACGDGSFAPGQEEECHTLWRMQAAQMIDWGNQQAGVETVLVDKGASTRDKSITVFMLRDDDLRLKDTPNRLQFESEDKSL